MNRWSSTLPWVLVAVLAVGSLVALAVVSLDPAPRDAQTALDALDRRSPSPAPSPPLSAGPVVPAPSTGASTPPGTRTPGAPGSTKPPRPGVPTETRRGAPAPAPAQVPRPAVDLGGRLCLPRPRVTPLRVATFNIHGGIGPRGRDLAGIVEEIRALEADVVMLQEVDRFRPRTGAIDMPAVLAQELGMSHAFAPNVRFPGRAEYGVATLSRLPIVETEHVLLPHAPGTEQRGVLRTRVQAGPELVDVYNTHFDHTSDPLRRQQADHVRGLVQRGGAPVVLGGDFNASPATVPYATLTSALSDAWTRVGVGRGPTAGRSPGARIDYVFVHEAAIPRAARVVPSAVSDHDAVAVDLLVAGLTECE